MIVKLTELHCNQCNNNWNPRIKDVRMCPECKSPYWDAPKREKRKKKKKKEEK